MARRPASRQRTPVAKRGDIYLVTLDPTEGHEQRGRRPVLVVSPGAFNQLTRVPIVLPITTGGNFARVNRVADRCWHTDHRGYSVRPAARPRPRSARRAKA